MTPYQTRLWRTVLRERPILRLVIWRAHIPSRDRPDLMQIALLGAWEAIMADRLVIPDGVPMTRAVRAWLFGIGWRTVTNYRRHGARVEVLCRAPVATYTIDEQVEAREQITRLGLPRDLLTIFEAMAAGETIYTLARQQERLTMAGFINFVYRLRRDAKKARKRWR